YYKKWTETSDNSSLTSAHTVGDLSASTYYTVWYTKSGEDKTRLTTEQADGSSQIAFTYDQGYSDVIFEIEEDDNAPAAFELSSPANNSWTNDNTPTLSWNASSDTESGLAKYQLWINDTLDKDNIDSSATSTTPTSALSDGSYTWYIKAIDNNSNERQSTSTRTINIDTVSSFATFDSSAPANPTNQNTTDVTVAGTDITHYKYKLDDGSYSSETAIAVHLALSDLTDGEHTISLIGKDTAGNWQAEGSATTHTWTVDITSPVISLVSPANNSSTGDNTPTLTWSGSDATSGIAKYQLYVDGSLDTDNISSSATSVTPTDSLSCDSHTWYIRAYDNVDNYTDSSTFNLIISCGSGFISSSPPIISLSPNQTFEIITINNQSIINLSQVENAYQIAISTTPDFEFVSWEPYQENVVLPDAKKVYLKFRSETGGVSEVYEVETRQCLVSTNLLNGSLIRAINNYKVYIINNPSIGSGQAYIRHIIDEIIFTFYGHLNKDNIQEIDPSLMDNYQESYLIREINDYKVYKIINNKKHWLNISVEEFAERGYGWDEVFVVNEEEKDWYEAGEEIRH
ncbi:MAG: hypothetical protein KAQ87_02430, partial [Candidatus Pacebacteria bacterium]|nr:hypothetical protein [Candidatus Paceibacterota bacterium]